MLLKKLYFPYHKPPSLRKDWTLQTTSDDANLISHKPLSQRSIVIRHVLSNRHKLNKARKHKATAHNKKRMRILKRGTGENNKWYLKYSPLAFQKLLVSVVIIVQLLPEYVKCVRYHMAWCVLRLRMEVTITQPCGYLCIHDFHKQAHKVQGGGLESKNPSH
jgi:hypothetical protein